MSAIDLITCLPVSLSCEVLSRWLQPEGLSLLDSAYCSKTLRPRVAALYVADEFVLDQCVRPSTEPCTLPWLLKRKIKASFIEIDNPMDVSPLSSYLQHFDSTVRNVALIDDSAPDTMAVIAQYCTNLTRFSCISVLIDEHFHVVLERNPSLEILDLGGLHFDQTSFANLTLPHLHTVSLNHCHCYENCVEMLHPMSSNIQRLDLYYCHDVRDESILTAVRNCPKLIALGLGGLPLSDDLLEQIGLLCPHVYNLALLNNPLLTDSGLHRVLRNLHHIRMLDIQTSKSLTDLALSHIATCCGSTLECVYIGEKMSFSIPAVAAMVKKCPHLRTLTWAATDDFVCDEKQLEDAFSALCNIKSLLLGDGMCSDAALCQVAKHCTQLHHLNIYRYTPFETDSDYDEDNDFVNLHYTAEGVFAVARGCTQLSRVVCKDEEVLNDLAKKFWKLQNPLIAFSDDDLPFCSSIMTDPMYWLLLRPLLHCL